MNEVDFHRLADITLASIFDALDYADETGMLDVEYQNGVITIEIAGGKQFIVSKHAPSRQLWLSSPISGGLHFSHDDASGKWKLADGRTLDLILSAELKTSAGIEVKF